MSNKLNDLMEANQEHLAQLANPDVPRHLRRLSEIMLTIPLGDRSNLTTAATLMMNHCGGRRSDAVSSEAQRYHSDPIKWRAWWAAEDARRIAAREEQKAARAAGCSHAGVL
jgi:hypothetical protein